MSTQGNPPPSEPSNAPSAPPLPQEDVDITGLLEKMQRDIAKVSENTTSEKNERALNRIEEALQKVIGAIGAITGARQEGTPDSPSSEPTTPQSPDVTVPGVKWLAIRKRGGRVVKRAVPVEEKPSGNEPSQAGSA